MIQKEADWGKRRAIESRCIDLLLDKWRRGILSEVKVVVRKINLIQSEVKDQLKIKQSQAKSKIFVKALNKQEKEKANPRILYFFLN